jgi:hypothetical protein
MSRLVKEWQQKRPADRGIYRLSIANQISFDWPSEIEQFGSIVCIPKFGVVRLGEMVVHHHSRTLVMFQVQMCSSGHGTTSGGGTTGSGGTGGG